MSLRLYKKQKLCSVIAIEQLFNSARTTSFKALEYPLRAIWISNPRRSSDAPIQFLISVPKRRLHSAVDRVKMRRRIREAFRLHHQEYPLQPQVEAPTVRTSTGAEVSPKEENPSTGDTSLTGETPSKEPIKLDVAFVYVADKLTDYRKVEKSMLKLLKRIQMSCSQL